jgi:alkaline phosphatase D
MLLKPLFFAIICILGTTCVRKHEQKSIGNSTTPKWPKYSSVPMIQVASSSQVAQFQVLLPRTVTPQFEIRSSSNAIVSTIVVKKMERMKSKKVLHRIRAEGLSSTETYKIKILDGQKRFIDERTFSTPKEHQHSVKFAVSSCMVDSSDFIEAQEAIYTQLEKQNPDLIILNGDTVYVDSFEAFPKGKDTVKKEDLWHRYVETWERLKFYRLPKLIPVLATWDDHDTGLNDSNYRNPFLAEASDVFQSFFGADPIAGVYFPNAGVSSHYVGFGQRFFMMDDRSWRREPGDLSPNAHWGELQEKWLFAELNSTKNPAWIINGTHIFGGHHHKASIDKEHPRQLAEFIQRLTGANVPLALITGDIHMTEISRIPLEGTQRSLLEFNIGPWHSRLFKGVSEKKIPRPNPHRIGYFEDHNFMTVESDASQKSMLKIKARVWSGTSSEPVYALDDTIY